MTMALRDLTHEMPVLLLRKMPQYRWQRFDRSMLGGIGGVTSEQSKPAFEAPWNKASSMHAFRVVCPRNKLAFDARQCDTVSKKPFTEDSVSMTSEPTMTSNLCSMLGGTCPKKSWQVLMTVLPKASLLSAAFNLTSAKLVSLMSEACTCTPNASAIRIARAPTPAPSSRTRSVGETEFEPSAEKYVHIIRPALQKADPVGTPAILGSVPLSSLSYSRMRILCEPNS